MTLNTLRLNTLTDLGNSLGNGTSTVPVPIYREQSREQSSGSVAAERHRPRQMSWLNEGPTS